MSISRSLIKRSRTPATANKPTLVAKLAAEFRASKKKNVQNRLANALRDADSDDSDEVLGDLRIEIGKWFNVDIDKDTVSDDYQSERLWCALENDFPEGIKLASASGPYEMWEVRAINEVDARYVVWERIKYSGAKITKIEPRYPEPGSPTLWRM